MLALTCSGFAAGLRLAPRAQAATGPIFVPGPAVTGRLTADRYSAGGSIRAAALRNVLPQGTKLLVRVTRVLEVVSHPGTGKAIGVMPSVSRYYHQPIEAWVLRLSPDGRYGRVQIPYSPSGRLGWIRLAGLPRSTTEVIVLVDLSDHLVSVQRSGRTIMRFPAATGAPTTPTPPGDYFVTDRVAFPGGGPLGTFAFGISGIQTHLPPGWTGGNQLAIHGTNAASSIGTSASAGCVRVSQAALDVLEPLLRPGTPVIIRA